MDTDEATAEEAQVTVLYTSHDVDGKATATEVRSILANAGLYVRPGEWLTEWRFDRDGVSYRPAVGFGFGGPTHADLVVIVLDWLTPWLNPLKLAAAGSAAFFLRSFFEAAGKDAWTALKAGILALKQHQWRQRAPRGVRLIFPISMPEGVRWVGFQLPPLAEDMTEPLARLDDVQLKPPRPGHGPAVIWLKWDRRHQRWRPAGASSTRL